jgi:hypothetical protein
LGIFPFFAQWLAISIFKYEVHQQAGWLWYLTARFFYTWYTFLAIGVAEVWAVATTLAKKQWKEEASDIILWVLLSFQPLVRRKIVFRCINSLFKCAEK